MARGIPKLWADSTVALLRDPYRFIDRRCTRQGSDVFETRLLLEPTMCMRGRDAAALFYDERRFVRTGAAPAAVQKTLFGVGGVQGLDGAAHRHRKQLFLEVTEPARVAELANDFHDRLQARIDIWQRAQRVELYPQMQELLTAAVCSWAGVPVSSRALGRMARDLAALFDHAGAKGPKHFGARLARRRLERWLGEFVGDLRSGAVSSPSASVASLIAQHRDPDGRLLPERIAAVELLNVLRPVVAVAVFVVFVVLALHQYSAWAERLQREDRHLRAFVQEVRRFYPFFPLVAARVADDFFWHGQHFARGQRVLLDLYGTDHDSRCWSDPHRFRPERFTEHDSDPFALVPQGGGDPHRGHRCPGEGIAIALMETATRFFTRSLPYTVPAQNLNINYRRLPALPHSGMIIEVRDESVSRHVKRR